VVQYEWGKLCFSEKVIMINKWVKMGSFLVFLILIVIFINTKTFSLLIKGDFLAIAESDGLWVLLLLSLGLMIIQNLFTVIPLILLISINVTMYGFVYGYIWSWVTSIIGALVSFLVVRFWFQEIFIKKLNEKMKEKIENNGFAFVFIGRIFPFVPTSLINIAAGLSSINLKHFTFSTILGNMIYMFVLALIPLGIMSINIEYYIYFILIGLFIASYLSYKMVKRKCSSRNV
jgi:uncharacterized membrane protein YdjX (TVP38/TMEM64 family)